MLLLGAAMAACGGGGNDAATVDDSREAVMATTTVPTDLPASREEAARFLAQATFGPNDAEIDRLMTLGYRGWIRDQLLKPTSSHRGAWEKRDAEIRALDPSRSAGQNEVVHNFWKIALTGEDQLRQRVAYALSQIFVISMVNGSLFDNSRGVADYLDMLAVKGLGNYRDLLEGVSRHPMMGLYLSHLGNQKANPTTGRVPDQNYAREVMQLFSIGLYQLNPDGSRLLVDGKPVETYTDLDIFNLSHVFTGFSWAGPDTREQRFYGWDPAYRDPDRSWKPMQGYRMFHSARQKTFLGTTIAPQTTPAPDASLQVALDTLFNHPNVGPFIGRQLIQRLVTSNPSRAYVRRVAAVFADNGKGVRGDMAAVVRAILVDPEARDLTRAGDTFGKLREPVLRLSAVLRAFKASSDSGYFLLDPTDDPSTSLGQTPMRAPSVFNFYRPGYVPPQTQAGAVGLTVPEMQITHETSVAGYVNFMRDAVRYGAGRWAPAPFNRRDIQLDLGSEPWAPAVLAQRVNSLLAYGRLPSEVLYEIQAAVSSIDVPALLPDKSNLAQVLAARRTRAQVAIFLTAVSPEFIVQK